MVAYVWTQRQNRRFFTSQLLCEFVPFSLCLPNHLIDIRSAKTASPRRVLRQLKLYRWSSKLVGKRRYFIHNILMPHR